METIKKLIALLDIPSGSILGLFTLIMIGLSLWLTLHAKEFPASVVSIYQFVVGVFAGATTAQAIWKKDGEKKD